MPPGLLNPTREARLLEELLALMFGHADIPYETTIPLDGDFHYRCEPCDVAGFGRECWLCGNVDVTVGYRWGNGASGPNWAQLEAAAA